jgi:hypothetical protein
MSGFQHSKPQFELVVEPGDNPFDVYEYPYPHAACWGINYRPRDLRQAT